MPINSHWKTPCMFWIWSNVHVLIVFLHKNNSFETILFHSNCFNKLTKTYQLLEVDFGHISWILCWLKSVREWKSLLTNIHLLFTLFTNHIILYNQIIDKNSPWFPFKTQPPGPCYHNNISPGHRYSLFLFYSYWFCS